ncbi:MAG: serine hydrolase domain-containing protein [Candidatus Acidiferrales bacterium]
MKGAQFSPFARMLLAVPLVGGMFLTVGGIQTQAQQANHEARDLASPLAEVKPEAVGFSSDRLGRLDALMQREVEEKQFAGIVTMLARHGKVVEYEAYGKKDLSTGAPMTKDTIFRIYSMTKPVTGVAMMILYEEGKWLPSDPISKYIPEFAHLKVFKGVDQDGKMILEDPVHPPTMGELMTHTAGFTYGQFGDTPVHKMYLEQHVQESGSLQGMIDKLAKIPLLYQPGTEWVYSVSVDIQGYIVEKLSGESLPDFMREHIFEPLGMRDTGFYVPAEKRSRFTTLYHADEKGELIFEAADNGGFGINYFAQAGKASGGGGLVSTARDYMRFAQMLLDGGALGGVRILAPATVKLMTSNHLPPSLMTGEFGIGAFQMKPGFGYGFDVGVFTDPMQDDTPVGAGTFTWDGAAATWFWVDPANDIAFVGMVQRRLAPGVPNLEELSRATVLQALVDPHM